MDGVSSELRWNILPFFVSSHFGRLHLSHCHLALMGYCSLAPNSWVTTTRGGVWVSLPPFDPPLPWFCVMVLFLFCLPHQLGSNKLGAYLWELLRMYLFIHSVTRILCRISHLDVVPPDVSLTGSSLGELCISLEAPDCSFQNIAVGMFGLVFFLPLNFFFFCFTN